jgi:uncharacterized protein (TIGR02996 family)
MKMEKAFLSDIVAHSADDAPRLIYADWLDEHGDTDRADHIRTAVALAHLGDYDERRPELLRREQELFLQHGDRWSKPLYKFTRRIEFRRGFVGKMTLQMDKFLKEAERIFAACPLEEVRPLGLWRVHEAVTHSPFLGRLRALAFNDVRLGAGRLTALADSSQVANLEELNLDSSHMRKSGARALFSSPHLANLKTLIVSDNALDNEDIRQFAQSRSFPRLTRLDLSANGLTDESLEILGRSEMLAGLRELTLRNNQFRDDGVRRLLASGRWTQLRKLDLGVNRLTSAGLRALASAAELSELTDLGLEQMESEGVGHELAQAANLGNLRALDLTHQARWSNEDIVALTKASFLLHLRVLRLPLLSPDNLHRVLRNTTSLWHLHLSSSHSMGTELHEVIAATPQLKHLTHLTIQFGNPGTQGIADLANSRHLSGLLSLSLWFSHIGEGGYRALLESPYLSRWCRVDLRGNEGMSAATRQALEERFGEVLFASSAE